MPGRIGTLLALTVATLVAATGSASGAGWQPVVNAETGDKAAFATEIAIDAQGNAVAVWARHVDGLKWEIVASSRPRGGKWTVPVAISGDTRTGEILRSKVAVDPNGNAVAVWVAKPPQTGGDGTFKTLWSASRSPGGVWGEPEEISVASGVSEFDVVMDGSGTATAIWHSFLEEEDDPPGNFVRTASRPLAGAWSDPVELSGPANGGNPKIAVNSAGDLTAAWIATDPGTDNFVVRSKSRPAGGTWSATADDVSSPAADAADVQLSVDPEGNTIVAWPYIEEDISGDPDIVVQTAYRSKTSGTWSTPNELLDDQADEKTPEIALATDPQGNTTAIWSSFAPGGNKMLSSARTAGVGGAWSTPVELSTPDGGSLQGKPTNPRIVADPQGSVTATWSAAVGPNPGIGITENRRLQAVHRPAGGAWESPVALSTPDDVWAAEIAADPLGYVTTLWSGTGAMRSRVFDSVAPLLQSVTVPSTGVVGVPVAMSVDPSDVWSIVTTGWGFGDSSSGSGATVSHCYSAPGEYTVTITGTDLAANSASAAPRTIEIDANPNAGPNPCVPPTVTGLSPTSGPTAGGTQVTITGTNFTGLSGPAAVTFGGTNAAGYTVVSPTQITTTAPARAAGTARIVVTNLAGPSADGPNDAFTYVAPLDPGSGSGSNPGPNIGTDTDPGTDPDPIAPVVTALQQSSSRWRTRARARRPRLPVGTVFRFRLNRAASVRLPFSRIFPGGKAKPRGALRMAGDAGPNTFEFDGKIRGQTLAPGRYRLTVTARADGMTSAGESIEFTIAP